MPLRKAASWVAAGAGLAGLLLAGFAGAVALAGAPQPRGESLVREQDAASPDGHVAASGFAVGPGLVVTNAHVTLRCHQAGLPLTVDGAEDWRVAAEDPSLELALLAGPPGASSVPPLRLSAAPKLARRTPVLLLGYPLDPGAALGPLRATGGLVERPALTVHRPVAGDSVSFVTTGPDGQPVDPSWEDGVAYFGAANADRLRWIVEIAASIGHGGSGGPVVDGAGGVVGVVFAGSPDAAETSAVALGDLRDFLLHAGVTPLFAPPAGPGRPDWAATGEAVAPSVVRVGC